MVPVMEIKNTTYRTEEPKKESFGNDEPWFLDENYYYFLLFFMILMILIP
jgi:hypothetical protein